MSTTAPDGVASTSRTTFSRSTRIARHIDADAATVWRLLTTAAGWPRWNSTVVSLDGQIAPGSRIKLVSTLAPSRTFRLKVKEFEPNARLTFGDAMSTHTYSLSGDAGGTRVEVVERIGGPLYPFVARMIPPFDENFEQFTADLKRAAEAAASYGR
ncbi:SRPBCC domain-containing protein [Agromyces sp. NPDC058484]|uniref:SRPBCC domain-containing protein n=1 Tax=Agromyces sp. NPDC058484 TaxID=3346524 RepID=UPI00365385CD